MAQSVDPSLRLHENLRLDLQHLCKTPDKRAWTCVDPLSTAEAETRGSRGLAGQSVYPIYELQVQ